MKDFPGTRITRRTMLWIAGCAATAAPPRLFALGETQPGNSSNAWAELVRPRDDLVLLARGPGAADVDAYLYTIAAMAVRIGAVPEAKLFPLKPRAPKVSLAPIHRGRPFVVIEWQMEPLAVFPPHNHPGYSVCTLGLEGEARLQHFEPCPDTPPMDSRVPFHVRLTRELVLGPRSVSTLAPGRDNIHTFTAGKKGARGIDITTLHAHDDAGFSYVDIVQTSRDGDRFEAVWTGT